MKLTQSIVLQFSFALESSDGSPSKVIHSPVSGCAYLIGAQFLGGDGAEAAPGLGLGGVQRESLLLSSGPSVGVTSLVGGPAALCTTECDGGSPGREVVDGPECGHGLIGGPVGLVGHLILLLLLELSL